jgi:hypothetical protein
MTPFVTVKLLAATLAQVTNAPPNALWQERQWQCPDQTGGPEIS